LLKSDSKTIDGFIIGNDLSAEQKELIYIINLPPNLREAALLELAKKDKEESYRVVKIMYPDLFGDY
jgi:hypothetical protein